MMNSRERRKFAVMNNHGRAGRIPDWTETSSQGSEGHQFPNRVPVVYYLYRNRHLEHPHFIEVPLSSSHGLFLRDFLKRLNVLRGKGMPALYSWSCKRSYKNGFVWHDLCEDDLIYPTNRNEYILKGSELEDILSLPTSGRQQQNAPLDLIQTRQHEASPSASTSSSLVVAGKLSLPSDSSPSTAGPEYKLFNSVTARTASVDATTQTSIGSVGRTCSRGIATEEQDSPEEEEDGYIGRDESGEDATNQALSLPCSTSSGEKERKPQTLEALINADRKLRGYPTVQSEAYSTRSDGSKPRMTDVLMQLISCGSISVKGNGFGIVPTYRSGLFTGKPQRFADSGRFPWKPGLMRELDSLCENPRLMGLRLEDKAYLSSSILETKKRQEEDADSLPSLKRGSSYDSERNSKEEMNEKPLEVDDEPARSKCIRRGPKEALSKLSKSPLADRLVKPPSSERKSSKRLEPFGEEERGKIVKIEES